MEVTCTTHRQFNTVPIWKPRETWRSQTHATGQRVCVCVWRERKRV